MDANVATPSLTYRAETSSGVGSDTAGEARQSRGGHRGDRGRRGTASGTQTHGRGEGPQQRGRSTARSRPERAGESRGTDGVAPASDREPVDSQRPSPSPFDDSRALDSTKRIDPAEAPPPADRADPNRSRQAQRSDRDLGSDGVSLPEESGTMSMDADIDRMVDVLYRRLERKLRIERQRKGL